MVEWSERTHYCGHDCLLGLKVSGSTELICQGTHGNEWRIKIKPLSASSTQTLNIYATDDSPRIAAQVDVDCKGPSSCWIETISFSVFPLELDPSPKVGSNFHQEAKEVILGPSRPNTPWKAAFNIFLPLSAFGPEGRYGYRFFVAFRRTLHELNDTDCSCQVRPWLIFPFPCTSSHTR